MFRPVLNHIQDALLQLLVLTTSLEIRRFYGRKSDLRDVLLHLVCVCVCVCSFPPQRHYSLDEHKTLL